MKIISLVTTAFFAVLSTAGFFAVLSTVVGFLTVLSAAAAADLPRKEPPPVAAAPIGKYPVGKYPVGKLSNWQIPTARRDQGLTAANMAGWRRSCSRLTPTGVVVANRSHCQTIRERAKRNRSPGGTPQKTGC
jgi:hypothetical protein